MGDIKKNCKIKDLATVYRYRLVCGILMLLLGSLCGICSPAQESLPGADHAAVIDGLIAWLGLAHKKINPKLSNLGFIGGLGKRGEPACCWLILVCGLVRLTRQQSR